MSTLILCKHPIAATPFYIEEAGMNVYSIEELSYYMLNNVYLLNQQFMSIELCNWLARECKLNKLSLELMEYIKTNAPLHIFVGHILKTSGYASTKEIKDLLAVISTFENKSEPERKKMRADRLMDKDLIVNAIYEYESIFKSDKVNLLPKPVLGDIYHNLGCAYAKLFFFDEAMQAFDDAYKRNQKKTSLYALLYSARCKKDKEAYEGIVKRYQVSVEDLANVEEMIKTVVGSSQIIDFDNSLMGLSESDAKSIIADWKNDYYRLCKI